MKKLTPSEKSILERLLYPEPFEVIQEETQLQYGEIRDDLINLMSYHLVEVVDPDKPDAGPSSYCDSDNLGNFTFRITKSGINHLKQRK
ncbi:MAG: hypothetical protein FH748_12630 [Balneolaceae bacterium]|nr:hypothetical protein [Balneolaceae bacterium]